MEKLKVAYFIMNLIVNQFMFSSSNDYIMGANVSIV